MAIIMFVGVPYDCLLTLIAPSGELPAIIGNFVCISALPVPERVGD